MRMSGMRSGSNTMNERFSDKRVVPASSWE